MTHADESGVAAFGGAGAGDELGETFDFALLFSDAGVLGGFFGGIFAAEIAIIPFVNLHFVGGFVDEEGFVVIASRNSMS